MKTRITLGEDFCPIRRYESVSPGSETHLLAQIEGIFEGSDLSIVNLEGPLYDGDSPIDKVGPNIKISPRFVNTLSSAGIDAVTLANNHIFDHGTEGLANTLDVLESDNIVGFGAKIGGRNLNPLSVERGGVRIAALAYAEKEFNLSNDRSSGAEVTGGLGIARELLKARSNHDVVLVILHGGNEHFAYPRPALRAMCHDLIALGADAVICHHPHIAGSYEILNGKPIVYSLGNLIFDRENLNPSWVTGYLATLDVTVHGAANEVGLTIHPYVQYADSNGVVVPVGSEYESLKKDIEALDISGRALDDNPEWEAFVDSRSGSILSQFVSAKSFPGKGRIFRNKHIQRLFFSKKRRLLLQNMLECDSHRELSLSVLKKREVL